MDVELRSAKRYRLIREIVETVILSPFVFSELPGPAERSWNVPGVAFDAVDPLRNVHL
jgi:hypothetical protein